MIISVPNLTSNSKRAIKKAHMIEKKLNNTNLRKKIETLVYKDTWIGESKKPNQATLKFGVQLHIDNFFNMGNNF